MSVGNSQCHYFYFFLVVTGKGEEKHLPKLFRSLMASGICNFQVVRRIGQLSPITSSDRIARMVGRGDTIPKKDKDQIGAPVRRYLNKKPCSFVLLIDDLEGDRREYAQQVFDRYRNALDVMLTENQKHRVAVHFLVNMLEAYFFADAQAVNGVLNCDPQLEDFDGDVEEIRHPKRDLRNCCENYDEIDSAGKILAEIDVEHVLSQADTCASLRTLFAWCVKRLEQHSEYFESQSFCEKYLLDDGNRWEVVRHQ